MQDVFSVSHLVKNILVVLISAVNIQAADFLL